MKAILATVFVGTATAVWAAAPVIRDSSVTMTQNPNSHLVTIGYTLEEAPAIVTVDIRTNGVSIGGANLQYFAGDVNKRVATGTHTMTWRPNKAWPGHRIDSGVTAVVTAWSLATPPDYMTVSLTAANTVRFYANEGSVPGGVTSDLYKTEVMVMRKCPAANVSWRMGSPTTELGRNTDREVPHLVTLTNDFYIGIYPVTQRQYQLVRTDIVNPSYFAPSPDWATRPVETVTYEDLRGAGSDWSWPSQGHAVVSTRFFGLLRTLSGINDLDLPTDAQWEFACRAGCGAALHSGKELEDKTTSANLGELARYKNNGGYIGGSTRPDISASSEYGTSKVGEYKPNDWGIYDMLGNVREWCLDWFQVSPLGYDVETGPTSGTSRALRGGCWMEAASLGRSAFRGGDAPGAKNWGFGFRVACRAEFQD